MSTLNGRDNTVDIGKEGALCLLFNEATLPSLEEIGARAFLEGNGGFLLATAIEDGVLF